MSANSVGSPLPPVQEDMVGKSSAWRTFLRKLATAIGNKLDAPNATVVTTSANSNTANGTVVVFTGTGAGVVGAGAAYLTASQTQAAISNATATLASSGNFTLTANANTLTVADANVTANSSIVWSPISANASSKPIWENAANRVAGVSFQIAMSANANGTEKYQYVRIN